MLMHDELRTTTDANPKQLGHLTPVSTFCYSFVVIEDANLVYFPSVVPNIYLKYVLIRLSKRKKKSKEAEIKVFVTPCIIGLQDIQKL